MSEFVKNLIKKIKVMEFPIHKHHLDIGLPTTFNNLVHL